METPRYFDRLLYDGEREIPCEVTVLSNAENGVVLHCEELSINIRGGGPTLLRSFDEIRESLEMRGLLLGCAGARLDVSITPLLEQEWNGRRVHLMSTPRRSTSEPLDTLDIFDSADKEIVTTLELQAAEGRAFARGTSKWSVRNVQ
jgi:hypothetical protein